MAEELKMKFDSVKKVWDNPPPATTDSSSSGVSSERKNSLLALDKSNSKSSIVSLGGFPYLGPLPPGFSARFPYPPISFASRPTSACSNASSASAPHLAALDFHFAGPMNIANANMCVPSPPVSSPFFHLPLVPFTVPPLGGGQMSHMQAVATSSPPIQLTDMRQQQYGQQQGVAPFGGGPQAAAYQQQSHQGVVGGHVQTPTSPPTAMAPQLYPAQGQAAFTPFGGHQAAAHIEQMNPFAAAVAAQAGAAGHPLHPMHFMPVQAAAGVAAPGAGGPQPANVAAFGQHVAPYQVILG